MIEQLKEFDRQVCEIESQIVAWHRENEDSRRLAKMPGIGPIIASSMAASIGDAKSFKNGRQVGAWLGLYLGKILLWQDSAIGNELSLSARLGHKPRLDCWRKPLGAEQVNEVLSSIFPVDPPKPSVGGCFLDT